MYNKLQSTHGCYMCVFMYTANIWRVLFYVRFLLTVNLMPVLTGMTYAAAKAQCETLALQPALLRSQEEATIVKNALFTQK